MDSKTDRQLNTSETIKEFWVNAFSKSPKEFQGNKDYAGELMLAFHEGISFVRKELAKENKTFKLPKIYVSPNPRENDPIMSTNGAGDRIYIRQDFLEKSSILNLNELNNMNAWGKLSLRITPIDFFRISGVEECHHSFWNQNHPEISGKWVPLPKETTQEKYDAEDHEYEALKWQIRFAKERGFDPITINMLEQQLANVEKLRKPQV